MSLSNDATTTVLNAIKGLMATSGQCFTAYDVTKVARTLTRERVHHDDVRQVIHNLYDQGFMAGFTRTNHSFATPQGLTTAQLFVPAGSNSFAYDPKNVVMSTPTAVPSGVALDSTTGPDDDCEDEDLDCDDDECEFDDDDLDEDEDGIASGPLPVDKKDFHSFYPAPLTGATSVVVSSPEPAPAQDGSQIKGAIKDPCDALGITGLEISSDTPLPPPAPVPVPTKDPVSPAQQEKYLDTWNKPEKRSAGDVEGETLFSKFAGRITAKLKNLLK